jgi:hypothetical protein
MGDLLKYDKTIVDSIHHVEDILVKLLCRTTRPLAR